MTTNHFTSGPQKSIFATFRFNYARCLVDGEAIKQIAQTSPTDMDSQAKAAAVKHFEMVCQYNDLIAHQADALTRQDLLSHIAENLAEMEERGYCSPVHIHQEIRAFAHEATYDSPRDRDDWRFVAGEIKETFSRAKNNPITAQVHNTLIWQRTYADQLSKGQPNTTEAGVCAYTFGSELSKCIAMKAISLPDAVTMAKKALNPADGVTFFTALVVAAPTPETAALLQSAAMDRYRTISQLQPARMDPAESLGRVLGGLFSHGFVSSDVLQDIVEEHVLPHHRRHVYHAASAQLIVLVTDGLNGHDNRFLPKAADIQSLQTLSHQLGVAAYLSKLAAGPEEVEKAHPTRPFFAMLRDFFGKLAGPSQDIEKA